MFAAFRKTPGFLYVVFFLLVNVFCPLDSSTNPRARLSTLTAITEDHTFQIDPYPWTIDWARTPDGHFYSTKAPGPVFWGWPAFWAIDRIITGQLPGRADRDAFRAKWLDLYSYLLSLVCQVLPFAILVALTLVWLKKQGLSSEALQFASIGMLFGNTASLLMNTYFGHGMAALFLLAMFLSLVSGRDSLAGFFWASAWLCDYLCIWVLVPACLAAFYRHRRQSSVVKFVAGSLAPLCIGAYYNLRCFGHPWTLPFKYINPLFVEAPPSAGRLWRILGFPDLGIMLRLLLDPSRGLLFTQPWILVLFGWMSIRLVASRAVTPWERMMDILLVPSLAGLILTNASMGTNWGGGLSPGPRFLSALLPLYGIAGGFWIDRLSGQKRLFLWCLLGMACGLGTLVLSTTLLLPDQSLWGSLLQRFTHAASPWPFIRFTILSASWLWLFRQARHHNHLAGIDREKPGSWFSRT